MPETRVTPGPGVIEDHPYTTRPAVIVLIVNGGGLPTLLRCQKQYRAGATHLGRLARPRHISRLRDTMDAGFKTGVDNDAFSNWDEAAFIRQVGHIEEALYGRILRPCERIAPLVTTSIESWAAIGVTPPPPLPDWHPNFLWMTVPDAPCDGRTTRQQFDFWAPLITHLPLAFCVQDGASEAGIPWNWPNLRCLFMAGTTAYKLSDEMAAICREGKRRGLWIHCGRVNSRRRIRYLLGLEFVDSIDGTGFDQWRNTHLPWGLEAVSATSYQLALPITETTAIN